MKCMNCGHWEVFHTEGHFCQEFKSDGSRPPPSFDYSSLSTSALVAEVAVIATSECPELLVASKAAKELDRRIPNPGGQP